MQTNTENKTAEILAHLKEKSDAAYLKGMLRFGIDNRHALGVKIPDVRKIARAYRKDHELAQLLWDTRIHEARILASMIDDPNKVTAQQIDAWTMDFYSWDLCDQVCGNLFDRTPFAVEKAIEFSIREEEFVKRAGFVLMAEYAVHNKTAADFVFESFFTVIEREATDSRNFVKKAVNWALRQTGKRNQSLRLRAVETANRIFLKDDKTARWIATNALAELEPNISAGR